MSSISLERCEINEDGEEQIQIINEMKDFVLDIASEGRISLEEAEETITEACDSWKQRLLEMCISKKASKHESEPIHCHQFE